MRRLSLVGAVAIVLMGLIAACGDPVSRNPMAPAAPSVNGLQVTGPSSIPPGQSAQFIANLRLSDGTVKSSTAALNVRWRSSNTSILQVSESGLAMAGPTLGEATVTAEVLPSATVRGTSEVVIVPDGTYRVVGQVREVDAPGQAIAGARVEVSGTSLFATTNTGGGYRLFGVPAVAELRVTADGYLPVVQNVQLTGHATHNFTLPLSGPRISLNGPYRLAVDVVGTCAGSPALPAHLQHVTYEAAVTTTGSSVDVRLTEPRFVVFNSFNQGNRFFGRTDPAGVRFTLSDFYTYYYFYYPSVAERLSDNTALVPFGTASTTAANGGVSGPMSGGIFHYDSRFPAGNSSILGRCSSSGLQLTLTPR